MFWKGKKDKVDYTTKDFYKYYKSISKNPVSYLIFSTILTQYFEYRIQLLIFNNIDINFPYRMGTLGIRKVGDCIYLTKDGKLKYLVDWGSTNKLWSKIYPNSTAEEIKKIKNKPLIYYTNDHTNGKVYDFIWDKFTSNFKYKSYYKFSITRKWKRTLKNFIVNSKNIKYYERN